MVRLENCVRLSLKYKIIIKSFNRLLAKYKIIIRSFNRVRKERDQYCQEMMRQTKDMMMHFENKILQRSRFTTQDLLPFSDDHNVDHLYDI